MDITISLTDLVLLAALCFFCLLAFGAMLMGSFALGAYSVFRTKTGQLDIPFIGGAKVPKDGGVGHYADWAREGVDEEEEPAEAELDNLAERIRTSRANGTFDLAAFRAEVTGKEED